LTTRFSNAKKTSKIIDATVADIIGIVNKGMILLGIKAEKLPTEFELTYMVQMIRQEFTYLPIGELSLAFELAATNKLDTEAETYQNFSVLYFSRMMSSYARWAAKQIYEVKQVVKELPIPNVDEDELIQMSLDSYRKTRQFDQIFMSLKVFNILHKRGLINFDAEDIVLQAEIELKRRITDNVSRKEIKKILQDDDQMELTCRRIALAEYFKTIL
jgi:hypothetical protein